MEETKGDDHKELVVSWTDLTSNSYGDIRFDESTSDFFTSNSSSQSPLDRRRDHHSHHQRQHHLQQQQQQHIIDQQHMRSPPATFITQLNGHYNTALEPGTIGHFEYGNNIGPEVVSKTTSEMRTGEGELGLDAPGRRGSKRKRGDKYEELKHQNKMDASQRCDVCGEQASGHYFGALVCLPCKSFFIRCTKDGHPNFNSQCGGKCDVLKGGRVRCQHCRFQKCIMAGMYRKEKPEAVQPAEGQVLCKVCGDIANGVHFGVTTCEGCKKFFRRGLKENKTYNCKGNMCCSINPRMRNNCRFCRYQKCLYEGMSREAIKMGRPKKGEIGYRKPPKKPGMKQTVIDLYNKQTPQSGSMSISSESDQDEEALSTSEDVFDPLSSTQHLQLQSDAQHLNSHLQPSHAQPLHQHQPGAFSLGSILHECMTVRDWDLKVEMPDLDENVGCSHSGAISSSSSSQNGRSMMEGCGQISSHVEPSSPVLLTDMMGRQLQQQQVQHHHHQQQQYLKGLEHLQCDIQTRRRFWKYEDNNPNTVDRMVITDGVEFSNAHGFPANMTIKVENVSNQSGYGHKYADDIALEDAAQGQTQGKADLLNYQMQGHDPNTMFSASKQAAGITQSKPTTFMPLSQIGPNAGSHVLAAAMSSQGVLYRTHHHQGSMLNGLSPHQQAINSSQNRHRNMVQESTHDVQHLDHSQRMEMTDVSPSGRGHNMITDPSAISAPHNSQTALAHSRVHNTSKSPPNACNQFYISSHHQQYPSTSTRLSTNNSSPLVYESLSHRKSASGSDQRFTILSFGDHHATESVPISSATSMNSPVNAHLKLSGARNSVAAILQQHRDAIQSGRLVHLSPGEVDELMNSVNAHQQRTQGFHINDHTFSGQRGEAYQTIAGPRTHSTDSFIVKNEQPIVDDLIHCNRATPQNEYPIHQGRSQSSGYQDNVPISVSVPVANRRQFHGQTSVSSDSNSSDIQEFKAGFRNIHNKINNNNISQVNHYTYHDSFNGPYNRNCPEVAEDSLNSALIRDSALLHDINRIFLGIDNSCETYGCLSSSVCLSPGTAVGESLYDRDTVSGINADEFSPEISHRYWHGCRLSQRLVLMTSDRQNIINDVLDAFEDLQKTYVTNEPEYLNLEHWPHIQRRIARHVVAGQRFCRNIPGYFKLDIQDRISLGKHVGFGLMVLIACTEFYDPEFKRFRHIWNWTIPMQNPLFSYKVHLLSLGDRIHNISLDRTEAAMLCAISMTSIDCPNLLKPEVVCVVRDTLMDALKAHIVTKSESTLRLQKLMSIMPQVRMMTVWYNNLMKKMSLPSEGTNGKISKSKVLDMDDTENTPSIG